MSNKKLLGAIVVLTGIFFASGAISQNIKLNPIKPSGNTALTDEQQAILAVRKAKASVVNIMGNAKPASISLDSGLDVQILNLSDVLGTGFIWDESGLVVTSSHVVADQAYNYLVELVDGSIFEAKVLGLDKFNDVALLEIDAQGLTSASLGNSDSLESGQSVFTIGNSLGKYEYTVSRGVVSGMLRNISIDNGNKTAPRLTNLIQTDAAINLGNSGGPLVNMAGQVVGVNTLFDAGGESLGFAVPINSVKIAVQEIKDFGKVSYPYAGISFETIDRTFLEFNDIRATNGAFVQAVSKGGPADLAGIKPGDVILEINHELLGLRTELDVVLRKYRAGDTVLVTLSRDGEKIQTPLLLGEFK